uniref:O-methyltransferase dimerisation domain-containing protein n=1 Tax=Oryza meridionalis TaxID=40149 RepID=A0A0E0DTW1_9ORYZ
MALKSALDLRIADAVHHHGGAATLAEIAGEVALHPSKIPCLRRLMRVLTVSGVFAAVVKQ